MILPLVAYGFLNTDIPMSQSGHPLPPSIGVSRTILDKHPRICTVALSPTLSVAYDASNCNLYKVWTTQPEDAFLVMPAKTSAWRVRTGSETYDAKPKWKGYHVKSGKITFNYEMMIEGIKVLVHETPEVIHNATGWIGLERSFAVENLPASAVLLLDVPIPNADGRTTTNGSLAPATELENNRIQEDRVLTLRPNGGTFLRTFTDAPGPILAPPDLASQIPQKPAPQLETSATPRRRPGDQRPLESVHPTFDLTGIRSPEFSSGITGMDFAANGDLILCTSEGNVYRIANFKIGPANTVKSNLIAQGLGNPRGLKVVGSRIFVMQRSELTELSDSNKDGEMDSYDCISTGWEISSAAQNPADGLTYHNGKFSTLNFLSSDRCQRLQLNLDGSYRITETSSTPTACISSGTNGETFLSSPGQISFDKGSLWVPKSLSPSPTEVVQLVAGPRPGQLIFGDRELGGLSRAFLEKVDGNFQGCVFRNSQGLGLATNRVLQSPDGALVVGGESLSKLSPNDELAFELQTVKLKTNGLQVTLSQSLMEGMGTSPADYEVVQFTPDNPTDSEILDVKSVALNKWRNQIFLEISGIKEGKIVHLRLNPGLSSTADNQLWSTEAWYSAHSIPTNQMVSPTAEPSVSNALTSEEVKSGFKLLFDGQSLKNFRGFNQPNPTPGWTVKDGAIQYIPGENDVDLMTRDQFDDFELRLDWKISKGGNSGIMFRVAEDQPVPYTTGPEMQILDNENHPDGKSLLTSAGSSYGLFPVKRETQRAVGQWNSVRIVAIGSKVEYWMNGYRVVQYTINSPSWKEKLKKAWFANPLYGQMKSGHITLQNHGNTVAFRNLRIRPIKAGHSTSR